MKKTWWKEAVVYQIYPRSFKDSDGDGIGDLRGIIQKLDYLKELGVDVVWLSPVYQSPNDDNGYDISDYQAIMTEFGTMADFDEMLDGMHRRGIKLIMDLVVNHTSDEHRWFQEARKSKENPYRDYYIWRPPHDGREPNNWRSFFSGSAWQYDEPTGEYYLHLFSRKQPDLNWENPQVRAELFKMMRWWLDKGVDGFRMDVINMISKVYDAHGNLPDGPVTGRGRFQWGGDYFMNGPRFLEFMTEMNREVLDHYDVMTVGETPGVTTAEGIAFTNEQTGVMSMLFQFEHMDIDAEPGLTRSTNKPWQLTDLKEIMSRWQTELDGRGWNSIYLTNHDQPRPVSRFGDDDRYRAESAKMLATFVHLQQGTPYIYQGEEIGMTNVAYDSIEDYNDIESVNMYWEMVNEFGRDPQEVLALIQAKGRDNARTPVQWDDSPNAGFTSGTPWLKVNPNYPAINVALALADPDSIFYYYQRLIQLRKQHPIMVYGRYDLILPDHQQIYAFTRSLDDQRLLVLLNFSREPILFERPAEVAPREPTLLIANYPVAADESLDRISLRPYEARVYFWSV
jgi:oligo-1,6-glucosidase